MKLSTYLLYSIVTLAAGPAFAGNFLQDVVFTLPNSSTKTFYGAVAEDPALPSFPMPLPYGYVTANGDYSPVPSWPASSNPSRLWDDRTARRVSHRVKKALQPPHPLDQRTSKALDAELKWSWHRRWHQISPCLILP